ncbi:DUF2490 domain-containing protein [Chryseolinea soli]|uniref:DUF2490 domain-containing protein n=1 Tax=Chryseolinea soli TaxID=2321403 RepID=A0A385SSC4_9BACT|nr:DUF2490 domain-containing protein [Chryseolinea soli]
MTTTSRVTTLVLLTLCIATGYSQTIYHHNVFWGRIALGDKITDRLRTEVWLQHRSQSADESSNIFQAPQYNSYWLWFNYRVSDNLKVSLSPFGYFETYTLYTKPSDLERPPVKEFRYTVRLEHEQKFRFFNYSNRYSMEYRVRDLTNTGDYQPNWRFRYMARLEKPIKASWLKGKNLSLIVYDEVMLQFGKAVRHNPNVFDQNRLYAGFSYGITKNIKITPAYLFVIQQRNSGNEFDYVNTLFVVLSFDNLISQFRKQEQHPKSPQG